MAFELLVSKPNAGNAGTDRPVPTPALILVTILSFKLLFHKDISLVERKEKILLSATDKF